MAFQKTFEAPSGNEGDYWRISSINIDSANDYATVVMALYKSSSHTNGYDPLLYKSYEFSGASYPFTINAMDQINKNCVKLAYEDIKANDSFFSDALDV